METVFGGIILLLDIWHIDIQPFDAADIVLVIINSFLVLRYQSK